jgi:hypothetical protein
VSILWEKVLKGGIILTKTIQSGSWVSLDDADKNQTMCELKTADNMTLLLSLFDSLNTLCEKLSKLYYEKKKKNMELIGKKHGINKENT